MFNSWKRDWTLLLFLSAGLCTLGHILLKDCVSGTGCCSGGHVLHTAQMRCSTEVNTEWKFNQPQRVKRAHLHMKYSELWNAYLSSTHMLLSHAAVEFLAIIIVLRKRTAPAVLMECFVDGDSPQEAAVWLLSDQSYMWQTVPSWGKKVEKVEAALLLWFY